MTQADSDKRSEFMFHVNEEERRGLSLLLSDQEGSQSYLALLTEGHYVILLRLCQARFTAFPS